MLRKLTWDEVVIVIALAVAGLLDLSAGNGLLGAILCVAAVLLAVVLWSPVRERLHIPPSPRRRIFR